MRKRGGFLAGLAVLLVLGGCGSSSATPAASPSPTLSPSPAAQPTPTPRPTSITPSQAPSPTPPAGFAYADFEGGSTEAHSAVVAVRMAAYGPGDRFVLQFNGPVPGYTVTRQDTSTFVTSPKGEKVTLLGDHGVLVKLHYVWVPAWTGQTDFQPGLTYLREASVTEDFEGYMQWGLGVHGAPALRVFTLTAPDRLVIDIWAG